MTEECDQVRFNIRLTHQDERVLDALAERTGIATRSELIRLALRFLLDNWPAGPRPSRQDHSTQEADCADQ